MYNIIPLVLIIAAFSVVIFIIVSKFSALAALDVESIPAVKESRFKEQIISNRLKRMFSKWTARIVRAARTAAFIIGGWIEAAQKNLRARRERLKAENSPIKREIISPAQKITQLFQESESLVKEGKAAEAEKKLIEIIALDSKNIRAFKLLGAAYFQNRQFSEARQTYEHIIKLLDSEDIRTMQQGAAKGAPGANEVAERSQEWGKANYDLALVHQNSGNYALAIENLKRALTIEPDNPRYLDTMIEISIISKDKIGAWEALSRLEKANPQNQKIPEFKEKIKTL